jgi:hypothetical protein
MTNALAEGTIYFAVVFAAGFGLGVLRTLSRAETGAVPRRGGRPVPATIHR